MIEKLLSRLGTLLGSNLPLFSSWLCLFPYQVFYLPEVNQKSSNLALYLLLSSLAKCGEWSDGLNLSIQTIKSCQISLQALAPASPLV